MNELIKQLAEQADEYTDNKIQMRGEYHPDWHSIRDAKFAELIVRECAGVTLDYKNDAHYAGWCDHCAEILTHFGIEQ